MHTIKVTPLTTTIGAEIDGIDLRQPLSEAAAETIRNALATHSVIVFHNQPITLEQQKAVAGIFGPLEAVTAHKIAGDDNPVTVLDNKSYAIIADDQVPNTFMLKDEFQEWHVDSSFSSQIPAVACLRAEVIPPVGGGTCWASMACAFEALSKTMQEWLETLGVVHAPPPGYRGFLRLNTLPKDVQEIWERECAARVQPLVVRHPINGRKILYVNPAYAVKVDKLSNSESAMLLRFLYNHFMRPDFVYRHRWSEGDILIWDELATTHLAPRDHYPHPRRVVRVFAGLTAPTAASPDFVRSRGQDVRYAH